MNEPIQYLRSHKTRSRPGWFQWFSTGIWEKAEIADEKKMIYRKWSLLTGPTAILGGIIVTLAVANFIFVENDPFLKPEQKKPDSPPSTK